MAGTAETRRSYSERVVVLAPTPRDGDVTRRLLAAAGIDTVIGGGWRQAQTLLAEGAGALMITDSTFAEPGFGLLAGVLERQPAWSNLPVLALCRRGQDAPLLRDARLRNLMLLDRPASTAAVVSAVRSALRGRRWQYQIRDQIESLLLAEGSLREADRRKDEFLATLAHELRNPLAPLRTGLQLLSGPGIDADRQRGITDMMNRQMKQLLRLIDDLLEISRISTGKLVLQREPLDLRRVVEMALEACEPVIKRGGHQLTVEVPDEEVCVDGDPARLAQSLSNLLHNAAKYTPDGGQITVRLARRGDEAVISVQDSGVGLPPEMIGRVFDMFAQVNRTLARSQGGLGIGLALVRSLVGMHGGRVLAESPGPGHGSTFAIELPLATQESAPAPLDETTAREPEQPLRILVVDDNEDAASSLAMLLSLSGHQVEVANSGPAALSMAVRLLPQVVFCDLGMPGMDGHQLAARFRKDPRLASTRLVALTGWGSEEDKRRSRASGFDEHLTKPASLQALSALLSSL